MAAIQLPPRFSRKNEEITIRRNKTSLEILMQMGFPRNRVEKALAANGDKGVQLASDWLLSHINDPTLDENIPRDYILYLCPVGQLQQEFLQFWKKSYEKCGWNRAHNYFPHITLCPFFKSEDRHISKLSHSLKTICEKYASELELLALEYFASNNFIGLFLTSEATDLLRNITREYADEAKLLGVNVEPHKKQLHFSLAYQFPTSDKEILEDYAKSIKLDLPVRWDLRLYSRDPRIANNQVRKVNYRHTPAASDELTLVAGDFIYLSEEEIKNSQDEWYRGVSWLAGCSGFFPGPYTERVAETETWTMHRSIPIIGTDIGIKLDEFGINGPIEFDNPLYHDEREQRRKIVHPDQVLHFPASPNRTKNPPTIHPALANFQATATSSPSRSPSFERKDFISSKESINSISGGSQPLPDSKRSSLNLNQTVKQPASCDFEQFRQSGSSSSSSNQSQQQQQQQQQQQTKSLSSSMINTTSNTSPQHTTSVSSTSLPAMQSQGSFIRAPQKGAKYNAIGGIKSTSGGSLKGDSNCQATSRGPRQLYVVRHGERIDFTFGKDWIKNSFDPAGNYIRYDLNMPRSLPKRKGGPQDFSNDSPLTVQGHFQAKLLGEALKDVDVPLTHIYASPALRCVETATAILEGLGIQRKIHIEPGLFEWLGWYKSGLPKFMTIQELIDCGFNIDLSQEPIYPFSKYDINEKTEQYYLRCHDVTKEILRRHEVEGGNVLVLGHAASLDVCTRMLVGQPGRGHVDFHNILHKIPYCAVAVAQEGIHVREAWYIIEPPVLPFAHTNNPKYNWTILTTMS